VFVALGIYHAMRMNRVINCDLLCPTMFVGIIPRR